MQKQAALEFLILFGLGDGNISFLHRAGEEMLLTNCVFWISLISQIRQNIEKLIVIASLSAVRSCIILSFPSEFRVSLLSKALFPVASP